MRPGPVSVVLVCLLASTMLAGCIDNPFTMGDDEPEAPPRPMVDVVPVEPDPRDAVITLGPGDDACTGCVALLPPGSLPEEAPPRAPPRDLGVPVTVPEPSAGDVFLVDVDPRVAGQRSDSSYGAGSEDPGLEFVGAPDLEVHLLDPDLDTPEPVTDHAGAAVFRAVPTRTHDDEASADDEADATVDQYWTVALHDRAWLAREDHTVEHADGRVVEPGERRRVVTHIHARAAAPFELGADLWGRSLGDGDRFRVARHAPGYAGPVALFDYTVRSVSFEGVVELVVSAEDITGATAAWRLWIDDSAPYPHALQRLWVGHPSAETTFLPFDVQHMTIGLVERGDRDLHWRAPSAITGMARMAAAHHDHDDESRFQVGDRFAPAVLDDRLVWGLSEAVEELFVRAPSFSAFMARHPDRVLVDASLGPVTAVAHGTAVGQLVWTLTFTDGEGDLRSWSLRRPLLEDGQVAGVTHSVAETPPPRLPDAVRALRFGDVREAWLATGDRAYDAWRAGSPDEDPNRALFRLALRADGTVGGTLLFGHETPEVSYRLRSPSSGALVGSHVVQDLHVGDIVETVRAHSAG